MFVVVHLPFADLRPFLADGAARRLARPTWPIPVVDHEFVRHFGPVRQRLKGGIEPWAGEQYFCDSSTSLTFTRSPRASNVRLEPLFRRLMTDGLVCRVDAAFKARRHEIPETAARAAAGLRVMVGGRGPVSLIGAGAALAQHYRMSSAAQASAESSDGFPAVRHGAPLLYVERKVFSSGRRIDLSQRWRYYGKTRTALALLDYDESADQDIVRRTRLHIVRLHCEFEIFTIVLRGCLTGLLKAHSSEALRSYLHRTAKVLLKREYHGLPQAELVRYAANGRSALNSGELSSLGLALASVNRGLREVVVDAAKLGESAANSFPSGQGSPHIIVEQGGSLIMGDQYNIGDHTNIRGVVGRGNRIKSSSFAGDDANAELVGLVEDLSRQLTELRQHLSYSAAIQAAQAMSDLSKETTRRQPRLGRIRSLLGNIADVVKSIGDAGLPTIQAIEAIRHLTG